MIFEKNPFLGDILNISNRRRQLLVDERRGAGTCDVPLYITPSLQLSLTLVYIKALSTTLPDGPAGRSSLFYFDKIFG